MDNEGRQRVAAHIKKIEVANFNDLAGQRFGKLVAIKFLGTEKGNSFWECLCDCGKTCKKRATHIKSGASTSCGCYNEELMKNKFKTHGLSKHPLFRVHKAMMNRCYLPSCKSYKNYGGRGISVCERWHDFKNFYDDVITGYAKGLEIDRYPDVNGDYCPENYRWANDKQQSRNKSDNVFIEYRGERLIVVDWAVKLGMKHGTLHARIKAGWDIERALTEPVKFWNR